MFICVYGAASDTIHPAYREAGERLGEQMAKHGHHLVFGGGTSGMMGAAARGITRGNAALAPGQEPSQIIGIVPEFFNREGVLYPGCTRMEFTQNMRDRKQRMEDLADAFLVTPGGIGTFDEFFEILTLRQLHRHQKPILIWNLRNYYRPLLEMLDHAIAEGFLLPGCRKLVRVCETEQEIMEALDAPMEPVDPEDLREIQAIRKN